jgi:outer membrane lipoprotein-sorting protein
MTRILLFLCLAAGLALTAAAPGAAQDGRDLARISAYLNAMRSAEGSFVQIAPNGETSDGRFYISRPGKIRFEYTPPNPTLVVSDGTWVAVFDLRTCSQQTAPLSQTPLELLLRDRIDLRKEGAVTGIERRPGQMRVTAVNPNDPDQGSITMIFSENPLELRQWIVKDAQGQVTTVALSEVMLNRDVDIKKFLPQLISEQCHDDRRRGVQR